MFGGATGGGAYKFLGGGTSLNQMYEMFSIKCIFHVFVHVQFVHVRICIHSSMTVTVIKLL